MFTFQELLDSLPPRQKRYRVFAKTWNGGQKSIGPEFKSREDAEEILAILPLGGRVIEL